MDNEEKKAEELLQLLGEELAKSREKAMEPEEQPERVSIPIAGPDKTKKRRRHLRQICAIFLFGILLATGITTVSSDAVRAKLFGFFFEDKVGYSDLSRTEPAEAKILYPTYLPEGYEKVSEEDIGIGTELIYKNEDGDAIHLLQITDSDMEESFDTERTEKKSCIVGDCQGYYLDSGGTHVLIWEKKGVYMKITATLDEETMVRIGSSLK